MTETPVLNKFLEIDRYDVEIMTYFEHEPEMSHSEVAKRIKKSQPAVGARISKLERKHLLKSEYGLVLSKNDFVVAFVSMQARNPKQLMSRISSCPFVLNAFTMIGDKNLLVWLAATNLEKLEELVEIHFRSSKDVQRVEMSVWVEPIKELIMPLNLNIEKFEMIPCGDECHSISEVAQITGEYEPVAEESRLNSLFAIDDDDKRIIMELLKNPSITFSAIGKKIGKSQPAVGARIAKMKRKEFLALKKGVNFAKTSKLHLAQVSITAVNITRVIDRLDACDSVLFGFRTLGDKSLVVYVASYSMDEIDAFVDSCLRADKDIKNVDLSIIITYMKDLVLPFAFKESCVNCNFVNVPGDIIEQPVGAVTGIRDPLLEISH
ncbi:MAG: Lrp/AsnC family transcriptional regulator [Promethearchaeota archaeon]